MNKRVLIIDDDIDMCMLLDRFLSKHGYEVETAHSGSKGLLKFKESDTDLILANLNTLLTEFNHAYFKTTKGNISKKNQPEE